MPDDDPSETRCVHDVPIRLYCDSCHGPIVGPFSRLLANRQTLAGYRPPAPPHPRAEGAPKR